MAFEFSHHYSPEIEDRMRAMYESLGEKERRRYAAMEAIKLPRGGIQYLANLLRCSRRTIERGIKELDELPDDPAAGQQRRPGGGRKKAIEEKPELEDNLFQVIHVRVAGDPEEPMELWTDLALPEMAEELAGLGTGISEPTLENLLWEFGISRRKIDNSLPGGHSPDRNEQFEHIAALREQFARTNNRIFSVDTKAKEHLGFLYREGRTWCTKPQKAYDHDFPTWAEGVVIPHGIYDLKRNHGHINPDYSSGSCVVNMSVAESARGGWGSEDGQTAPFPPWGLAIVG